MTQVSVKKAQRLAMKGEYIDAGDIYKSLGDYEKALEMYLKVKAYNRSAPLLEWLGRIREAARHFAKAKQFTKAAELFRKIKDYYEAGVMYREADIPIFSAEMFESAEAYSEAAMMYERARDYLKAGKLYLSRGMYGKAVICLKKVLDNSFFEDKRTEEGVPVFEEVNKLCGQAYEKLRKFKTAADYYFKADMVMDAVRMCRLAGNLVQSAKYLEAKGYWSEAAEVYREIGEIKKSQQLQIQNLLTKDKFSEAALLADDSGEFVIAAEAYEYAGQFARAGEMYHLVGKQAKAAEMFLKAGRKLDAAIIFEQMGKLDKAAELRELLGETEKAAELYALVGQYLKSGRLYLENKRYDDAIRVLQNAWSQDIKSPAIRNALGLAFLRRGNFDLAFDNYLKFMLDEPVDDENIHIFYELACGFESRGQQERAVKIFERILAFQLNYKDVKRRVSTLSRLLGTHHKKRAATTLPHQFMPGKLVADRYMIKEKVGSGGMGVVYRAWDEELEIEVALKVLKPKYSKDAGMVQRFKSEVTLARQIHHENVVQLYDFGKIHNVLYISMEFFPSRDLKAVIRSQGPLSVDDIIQYMTQVCAGLWAAHRRGIIHRDIKPQNILINDEHHVKLVDFGIATMVGPAAMSTSEFVIGTPEYMSPEQAKGEQADTRSDIYSLGTILYEAATGRPPFMNRDSFQVLIDQVETIPPEPITRRRNLPRWLNDLILRCLEKNPDKRYDTVQFIERQLATCGIADLMLNSDDEEDDFDEDIVDPV